MTRLFAGPVAFVRAGIDLDAILQSAMRRHCDRATETRGASKGCETTSRWRVGLVCVTLFHTDPDPCAIRVRVQDHANFASVPLWA